MCRLFGILAAGEVELKFSLLDAPAQFHARGHTNPDGWGIGFIQDGEPKLLKHELPAKGALTPEQGEGSAASRLLISHVRRSSRAPRALHNCHPFTHQGWMFAHNGALFPLLEKWVRKNVGPTKYEGQTESESIFRWILINIAKAGSVEEGVARALTPLVEDGQLSSLNFLLAKQDQLYAFRYAKRSTEYYSLYYLRRPAGGEIAAESRDVHSKIGTRGLAGHAAVVVASEPLGGGDWKSIGMGHLLSVNANLETKTSALVSASDPTSR